MILRRRLVLILAAACILALGILFFFHEPILLLIGDYLVIQDKLQRADVIHVVSGEEYRPQYGIELYLQGYSKFLFFTGGWCERHYLNHAQHSKKLALAQGVPEDAVHIDETEIDSTYAEAVRLKKWTERRARPINSIIVVSDPYHMRRSRWVYQQIFGDEVKIIMAPIPFEQSLYQRQWWIDAPSRSMVKDEYLKLAYYLVRYQISQGTLREWLATFDRY